MVRDQTTEEIDRKIADQVLRSGISQCVDVTKERCAQDWETKLFKSSQILGICHGFSWAICRFFLHPWNKFSVYTNVAVHLVPSGGTQNLKVWSIKESELDPNKSLHSSRHCLSLATWDCGY